MTDSAGSRGKRNGDHNGDSFGGRFASEAGDQGRFAPKYRLKPSAQHRTAPRHLEEDFVSHVKVIVYAKPAMSVGPFVASILLHTKRLSKCLAGQGDFRRMEHDTTTVAEVVASIWLVSPAGADDGKCPSVARTSADGPGQATAAIPSVADHLAA